MKAKERTEKRVEEEMTGEKKVKCEESREVAQEEAEVQKGPSPKQRGLFSDRDPSQETQLENRLNRLSKLLADIAQHVRKHHVNKVCYAGL